MQHTVVLNSDYSFLNIVDWKRAMSLVLKNKVHVLKYFEECVRTGSGCEMKVPAVLRLFYYVRGIYRSEVPFTKRNVFFRDGHACAYCGSSEDLTIDHVIPISKGGKTIFENCITCCRSCNCKKGDRTPEAAKMKLLKKPYKPSMTQFIFSKFKNKLIEVYDTNFLA